MKLTAISKILATVCTVALTQLGFTAHAENIPGVAVQPASYFYTGKPYDNDLGEYTFAFRNYSPQINRWTSADPSGFPDGANPNRYASIPTYSLDVFGLADTVTWKNSTPTTGATGANLGIHVTTGFQVDNNLQPLMVVEWTNTPQNINGWVIQHVNIAWDIKDDTNNSPLDPFGYQGMALDYWEAWRWENNAWGPGNSNTDTYRSAMPLDSHGQYTVIGKVDFYQDSAVSGSSPSNWSPGNTVNIPSGTLRATTSQPSWWAGSGFNHDIGFGWE